MHNVVTMLGLLLMSLVLIIAASPLDEEYQMINNYDQYRLNPEELEMLEKRAWNSGFTGGMGKRAWNSGFTGGMGKRAWNSGFTGGMGKRAWNSGFTGGMGKRAWNSGFTGGMGK